MTSGTNRLGGPAADSLLEPANFATRFAAAEPRNRAVRRLQALLWSLGALEGFDAQSEWLEDLASWLFELGAVPGRAIGEPRATARLRLFLTALESLPQEAEALRRTVSAVFLHTEPVRLFTDTGIPSQLGFFSEAVSRVSRALLPEAPVGQDTAQLLGRLFHDGTRAKWLESMPPALWSSLLDLARPDAAGAEALKRGMREAVVLLATRIAALGLADDVRERLPGAVARSPFLKLPPLVRALVEGTANPALDVACREGIAACRKAAREVVASLDQTGVSVDLVYRLELINRQLDRLYALVTLLSPKPPEGAGLRFFFALVRGGVRDRSLRELFRSSSTLLAQRVIERAGHGGEHYITRSRAEQHQMVSSAGGGGALTGLTVVLKFAIGWAKLPILFAALAGGLNYALSFVAMQLCGFTLATKQPAMTAAHLAAAIQQTTRAEERDLSPLVELVARTVRSQLSAIAGNLGVVIPTVLVLDGLAYLASDHHLLDDPYATAAIASCHPLRSGTVFFAMFTGVLLWCASLFAGVLENWFVLRRLPGAIATHRGLRALVGTRGAQAVSRWMLRHIGGFGGNVSLGLLLGMTPLFGQLTGLPVDNRHITLVTGTLTFAGLARGPFGVLSSDYLWALSSIFLIGLCNFGVSFALALTVALRAREVGALAQLGLAREVLKRLWKTPMDFVRAPTTEPGNGH